MKIRPVAFGLLKLACALFFLTGCFGGGPALNFSGLNFANLTYATVSVSPRPVSIAAGTTQTFTATTTNSGGAATVWALYSPSLGTPAGAMGTLSATSGDTITYTAPSTPPIYTTATASQPQGSVLLGASVSPTNAGYVSGYTYLQFVITAPSVSTGLAPVTASVALGATEQFNGYAVGSANQGLTWQVNGVTGGSMSYGTITQSTIWPYGGFYTAPTIMPMTGPNVTITMISQADPTKTQTAVITLH